MRACTTNSQNPTVNHIRLPNQLSCHVLPDVRLSSPRTVAFWLSHVFLFASGLLKWVHWRSTQSPMFPDV